MGSGAGTARETRRVHPLQAAAIVVGLLAILGALLAISSVHSLMVNSTSSPSLAHPFEGNSSGGSDPTSSASASTLCPSGGPVFLGVEWNCVALLNATEVLLILASIGIVAYVFRDSDRAELPGEAAVVPVTAEEEQAYRDARRRGVPYSPNEIPGEDEQP